jgi:hypothetical protein
MTTTNALLIDNAAGDVEGYVSDVVVFTDDSAIYLRLANSSLITIYYNDLMAVLKLVSTEQGWADEEIVSLIDAVGADIIREQLPEEDQAENG